MPAQNGLALHILKAELAHVQPPQASVFLRVRRMVPRVQLVAAEHDGLYHVAALRHLAGQTEFLLYRREQAEGQGDGGGRKRKGTKRTRRRRGQASRQRGERRERGKDHNYSGKRIK